MNPRTDTRIVAGANVFVHHQSRGYGPRDEVVEPSEGKIVGIGRKYVTVKYDDTGREIQFEFVENSNRSKWREAGDMNYKASLYFSRAEFDEQCIERPNLDKILQRAGDWQSRVSLEKMPLEELRTVTNILSKYLK